MTLFSFIVKVAFCLDLAIFGNRKQIRIAANSFKHVICECLRCVDVIRKELANDIIFTLVFVERKRRRARNNRHFVHINNVDGLCNIVRQLISVHDKDLNLMSMSDCFVIQSITILYDEAKLILGAILLELSIEKTISIRFSDISHIRNECCHLAFIFILDFVACNFLTGRRILVDRIFFDIIAFFVIIVNHRRIRIIDEVDGHESRCFVILKISSTYFFTIGFTVICSRSPNLV